MTLLSFLSFFLPFVRSLLSCFPFFSHFRVVLSTFIPSNILLAATLSLRPVGKANPTHPKEGRRLCATISKDVIPPHYSRHRSQGVLMKADDTRRSCR
ncbi:hypothetical protein IE53DRAFT_155659 [Violaceomyces palustris]|uniref:Uncharacterized protein n=1 Tax=Violaceomyces palustris TaxID=1673888 RepID=A0ACD0NU22_9BASI|nr:hypothetical protein IE53DRAFT_155659 [Violaceomyces palustris]